MIIAPCESNVDDQLISRRFFWACVAFHAYLCLASLSVLYLSALGVMSVLDGTVLLKLATRILAWGIQGYGPAVLTIVGTIIVLSVASTPMLLAFGSHQKVLIVATAVSTATFFMALLISTTPIDLFFAGVIYVAALGVPIVAR